MGDFVLCVGLLCVALGEWILNPCGDRTTPPFPSLLHLRRPSGKRGSSIFRSCHDHHVCLRLRLLLLHECPVPWCRHRHPDPVSPVLRPTHPPSARLRVLSPLRRRLL